MFAGFSTVGFCGSRSLVGSAAAQVCTLASVAARSETAVYTTCGTGAAAAARACAPTAIVFSRTFAGHGALPARATRFIRALAAAPAPVLLCWPGRSCPMGLQPGSRWQSCGSGSWSELALAVGLGVPVRVFLPPPLSPPLSWGNWLCIEAGSFTGAWALRPPTYITHSGGNHVQSPIFLL
jgi:hypothetical protein